MPVKDEDRVVVEKVFQAMHAGVQGEELMGSLFADDAVVVEPFSGQPRTHEGKDAIMSWFRDAMKEMPPDMAITIDRLDMDQDRVRAEWTCNAGVFPSPMRGHDFYTIENGKIRRAEFIVTEMPPMEH